MPIKSKAQRRYLWAKHPKIAREFENKTPEGAKLPEHVKESSMNLTEFYKEAKRERRMGGKKVEKTASLSDLYLTKQGAGMWDVAKSLGTVAKGIIKEPVGLSQKARLLGQSAKGHFGMLSGGQKAGLIAGGAGGGGVGYLAGRD